MLSRCRSNQAAAGQRQHLSEAEKLQLWSPVISRVIVPVICPQVSHGTKPRSCETLFYVTGPAQLIYLHMSSSNATRVGPVFATVTSMHDA